MPVCRFIFSITKTSSSANRSFDEKENWFDDNGLHCRSFLQSALETVKKFGWPRHHSLQQLDDRAYPDVYPQCVQERTRIQQQQDRIHHRQQTFKEKLGNDFLKLATINDHSKKLEPFKDANNLAMFRGGTLCGCHYIQRG